MKKILSIAMLMLIMLPVAFAMGVTTPYWDTKPLILKPGESTDLELYLQNMVGGEDIVLAGRVVEGGDIAQITDSEKRYAVPFGEKNVPVHVRVTIPADAQPSDEPRIVAVSFFNAPQGDGSMVQIGAGVEAKFPVIVESESAGAAGSLPSATPVLAIAAVGIAVAAILILQRKRRRR